jgi:hypothetical protein
MDADEKEICNYLKGFPAQFISHREISRRAGGKRRHREEPDWATQPLVRLVDKGVVDSDATGHYCLKIRKEKDKKKKWVSPEIQKLLEKSGKNFSEVINVEEDEFGNA